jgi:magnesium-transporting ATPase (P-type)
MFISLILGSFTTLFELLFFALIKSRSSLFVETSMFLYLTCIQLVVIVSIRNQKHFWRGKKPSLLLFSAISLALVGSLALPYLPVFEHLFFFVPLPSSELAIILALVVIYVFALDRIKIWYYNIVEKRVTKSSGDQKGEI